MESVGEALPELFADDEALAPARRLAATRSSGSWGAGAWGVCISPSIRDWAVASR